MFSENFDEVRNVNDASYLPEELEQWLRQIAPTYLLGNSLSEGPHISTSVSTAWGETDPVVLGTAERDGHRAGELFNAAARLRDKVSLGMLTLNRKTTLSFIEAWRGEALVFTSRVKRIINLPVKNKPHAPAPQQKLPGTEVSATE